MYVFDKPVSKKEYKVEERIPLNSDKLVKEIFKELNNNEYYNISFIHRTKHLKIGNILGCKDEILKLSDLDYYLDFVVINVSILSKITPAEIIWN